MYIYLLGNQVSFIFVNKCNYLIGICDLKSGFIYVITSVLQDKILIRTLISQIVWVKMICPVEQCSGVYTNTMFLQFLDFKIQ